MPATGCPLSPRGLAPRGAITCIMQLLVYVRFMQPRGLIVTSITRALLSRRTAVGALILIVQSGVAAAQGATPPPAVSVTPVVSRQVTETGDFIGRVTAIDKVDIVARVPGFIEERNFTEGQQVKKGDLLFRIEQATYKAAVEQQRANLAKAKATEVNAKLQLERGKELVRNQQHPAVDARSARGGRGGSAGQRNGGAGDCSSRRKSISAIPRSAHPSMDGSGLPISLSAIWSSPRPGSLRPSSARIPSMSSFRPASAMSSNTSAGSRESPDKNPHVTVHIRLPNGSAYPHAGLSNFLDVQVDPNTDTVAVRAQVPNPDGLLIPGGIVGVTVERGAPRSALVVPQSAVQLDQAGRYVLVVDAAKKVELRRVTTGVEQGRDIVVTDGLKEGELVIVEGIQKVRPGQVVTASVMPGN